MKPACSSCAFDFLPFVSVNIKSWSERAVCAQKTEVLLIWPLVKQKTDVNEALRQKLKCTPTDLHLQIDSGLVSVLNVAGEKVSFALEPGPFETCSIIKVGYTAVISWHTVFFSGARDTMCTDFKPNQ